MGSDGRSVPRGGNMDLLWDGFPLFVRPFLEGCYEGEEEAAPRLRITDLQHPESFHERLAAFLMKQH